MAKAKKNTPDNAKVAKKEDKVKLGTLARAEKALSPYVEGEKLNGTIGKVDRAIGFVMPNRPNYQYDNEVVENASGPIKVGVRLLIIIFVFIGVWSAVAPLDSAAIASGQITLLSEKKTIDHLEGGIIQSFAVEEGDFVEKGAILLSFDDTKARASWEIQTIQYNTALARLARLQAERDDKDHVTFSESILAQKNLPAIAEIIDSENNLFLHRKNSLKGQESILKKRANQFEEEIVGLEAQKAAGELQLSLINEEVDVVATLVEQGKAIKPRLLGLQRQAAQVSGQIGEYTALKARARQSIAEAELNIIKLKDDFLSDNSSQLSETQLQLSDLHERITAAEDILNRVVIKAPTSGIVTGIKYHTVGGTVPPGQPIMDLVPQDDEKIVVARVAVQDIDVVRRPGLKAQVRLSAYRQRQVPAIDGIVTSISPNTFTDPNTGIPYYEARITLNKETIDSLEENIELIPGMGADVMIVTGSKTPLRYLMDPILSSTNKAWREQ
jgi:HlyD family type I secretion membrane fusion protein